MLTVPLATHHGCIGPAGLGLGLGPVLAARGPVLKADPLRNVRASPNDSIQEDRTSGRRAPTGREGHSTDRNVV